MAKVLRLAAVVVAIAAAIPSGGTSLLATGLASAGATVSATTASAIAIGVSVMSGIVSAVTAPSSSSGSQTDWKTDANAAAPIVFGRTLVGRSVVYQKVNGPDNDYRHMVGVLSGCGPIHAHLQTYLDKEPVYFSGTAITGFDQVRVWQKVQLGLCPEPAALTSDNGKASAPGWTGAHKLSGLAAVASMFQYDDGGDYKFTQLPEMNDLIEGVLCYDPRLDSTYPGGSGSCRYDDQSTWVFSRNGWIQAITFGLGWIQGPNEIRVGGVGMPITSIDLPFYVEAANIADVNGWTSDGRVMTSDDKWGVIKALCKAGGGEPLRLGATLSGMINTPRVPIGTITRNDVVGAARVKTTQTRRDRVNGIVPRYRSADHHYEVVSAGVVRNAAYLAEDGGKERTKEVHYTMVQSAPGVSPDQAAQLAAYDIANAREAGPGVFPLKPRWLGYKGGDCLLIEDAEEFGYLAGKKVLVLRRGLDGATGGVTLTLREETDAKHTEALSQVGVPPPDVTINAPPAFRDPATGSWTVSPATVSLDGVPSGVLRVSGGADMTSIENSSTAILYRETGSTDWTTAGNVSSAGGVSFDITGLDQSRSYDVRVQYLRGGLFIDLGPITWSYNADSTLLRADNNFITVDRI